MSEKHLKIYYHIQQQLKNGFLLLVKNQFEAFEAIRKKVNETQSSAICSITIDKMAIRKQNIFLNGKFYGGIDLGTGQDQNDSDNTQQATNA